ncbi:peroxide stress protein YaaA [Campylobacter sp. US33a]|uniref:Peroxide stress protein YaaA n=1 Tax=Campylobacter sp. CCS1377 TaxID=3158229 RepID=A0AAU7E7Y6_9BACT|nr:peroxide stress protein YaaA [Campylobacter sp. US33a]MCW1360504.1 peroxide stress protein YaaA [Campylobacter jejuni]TEY03554.1 peroxide stress protein YaaA [Campylobacter sp. US33a]
MKILFSPSESKNETSNFSPIDENSFIFPELFKKRLEVIKHFNTYISFASQQELINLFGIKKENEIIKLKQNLLTLSTAQAIERYSGVSYEYLDYSTLNLEAKNYILQNVIIFSNLFGPILAANLIPFYKFKQGAKIANFNIEQFYNTYFSTALDEFLKDEELLDLRAGFYEKFYTPKRKFSSYKFIKNGKIVSHFAKAYRGILLKILAQNQIQNNKELLECLPQTLKVKEVQIKGFKEEIILEIIS